MKPPETGFYPEMPISEFKEIDALSFSAIKAALVNMRHYRMYKDRELPEPSAQALANMEFGKAVHCCAFEPDKFDQEYVKGPDCSKASKIWKEFAREFADMVLLKAEEYDRVLALGEAVINHPFIRALEDPQFEVPAVWESNGMPCKGIFDVVGCHENHGPMVLDLKVTGDVSWAGFRRAIGLQKMHVQGEHYSWGAQCCSDDDMERQFILMAADKADHENITLHRLDQQSLNHAGCLIGEVIKRIERCEETGKWPGYPDHVLETSLNRWDFVDPEAIGT